MPGELRFDGPASLHFRLFEGRDCSLNKEAFSKLLQAGLKQLYGIIGGAIAFDIVAYDDAAASARVQVDSQ